MENASKSLLIAGAIFIAIIVVTVAVGIYQTASKTVHNSQNQVDLALAKAHNSRFVIYDVASLTSYEARECVAKVLNNNKSASDSQYYIGIKVKLLSSVNIDGVLVGPEIEYAKVTFDERYNAKTLELFNNDIGYIPLNKTFKPTITIGKNGLIESIYLEEIKKK